MNPSNQAGSRRSASRLAGIERVLNDVAAATIAATAALVVYDVGLATLRRRRD